jgi:hypothetical protein
MTQSYFLVLYYTVLIQRSVNSHRSNEQSLLRVTLLLLLLATSKHILSLVPGMVLLVVILVLVLKKVLDSTCTTSE